jgi:hypothetical protein
MHPVTRVRKPRRNHDPMEIIDVIAAIDAAALP